MRPPSSQPPVAIARAPSLVLILAASCALAVGCGGDDGDDTEPSAAAGAPASISLDDLQECDRQPVPAGYRCGSIEVPFERGDPSLGDTTVAFAVRERDESQRLSQGAIFAVEGGPGYSSSETANAFENLLGGLLRRRELVLVDMRGTGLSDRIHCPDIQRGAGPKWITASECARRLGPRFESYRTAAAADDIDAVREALGYERIALYGDSYGTFLGQSYAFRHGDNLNALVLDSAYPARGESPWYGSLVRTGVRALGVSCERVRSCSGDARKRLEKLAEFLREDRRGVGPLLDALQGTSTFGTARSYVEIDSAGTALRHGNPGPWERLTQKAVRVGFQNPRRYSPADEVAVSCNDYPMLWDKSAPEPERRAQLEQAIRDQDPDRFTPFTPREVALSSDIGYLYCLTWPAPTDLYEPPVSDDDEPTAAPVLVVSPELDSLTTPYEGRVVTKMFPNGRQYVAPNAGHVKALYRRASLPAREIRAFLAEHLRGGGG